MQYERDAAAAEGTTRDDLLEQRIVERVLRSTIRAQAFAIGGIYINVTGVNPATELGYGTWSAFGAGRVLVGFAAADPDFDPVENTGGAKTVAAAGAIGGNVANESLHKHDVTSNVTVGDHAIGEVQAGTGAEVLLASGAVHSVTNNLVNSASGSGHSHAAGTLALTGTPTSVLQPFIVVHFWKRTA